jgi:hypothetical protein
MGGLKIAPCIFRTSHLHVGRIPHGARDDGVTNAHGWADRYLLLGNCSSTTAPALSYYRPSMDICIALLPSIRPTWRWEVWKMQGAIFNLGHMLYLHFYHPWWPAERRCGVMPQNIFNDIQQEEHKCQYPSHISRLF